MYKGQPKLMKDRAESVRARKAAMEVLRNTPIIKTKLKYKNPYDMIERLIPMMVSRKGKFGLSHIDFALMVTSDTKAKYRQGEYDHMCVDCEYRDYRGEEDAFAEMLWEYLTTTDGVFLTFSDVIRNAEEVQKMGIEQSLIDNGNVGDIYKSKVYLGFSEERSPTHVTNNLLIDAGHLKALGYSKDE